MNITLGEVGIAGLVTDEYEVIPVILAYGGGGLAINTPIIEYLV